jgi:wyosine [tRNA(Phe)-imidazoG37] synthetase (radical SAM superfamily)
LIEWRIILARDSFTGITFGPVPSRRLGRSLGINNIPPKICSYACVYCQLGRTIKMQVDRQIFYQPLTILQAVQNKVTNILEQDENIDYLAFVPDGEPTLDINLGQIIASLKSLEIPVAVISNGSLIADPEVRNDLCKADWVSIKVDAVTEDLWRVIDRPHRKLNLYQIQESMLAFRKDFRGTFATETMLIKGVNDSESAVREIGRFLARLHPDIAYLAIPTRPPADKNIQSAIPKSINFAYQIISGSVNRVELLTGYEGNAFSFSGNVRSDILNITAVHPMRQDAVCEILNKAGSSWHLIENMLQNGEIIQSEFDGSIYFLKNFLNGN